MLRITLSLLSLFFALLCHAQMPNASFENGDDNNITDWQVLEGKAGIYKQFKFKANNGDTTVMAKSGNAFAVLQKAGKPNAIIRTQFAYNKRSSELSGKFIYLPQTDFERFSLKVVYLKWNDSLKQNDTMMKRVEHINPFGNEVVRNYNWFYFVLPIEKADFRMNGNPDSCMVEIKLNNNEKGEAATTLLADDLKFGTGLVAGMEEPSTTIGFSVYPNPAGQRIFISGMAKGDVLSIFDMEGKAIVRTTNAEAAQLGLQLQPGMYLVQLLSQGQTQTCRVVVY
ncbi:T9SS type A sorting domain-containing protein [bacterium]|nr:T9SS type A sorting domain-containing protein [bacterium]